MNLAVKFGVPVLGLTMVSVSASTKDDPTDPQTAGQRCLHEDQLAAKTDLEIARSQKSGSDIARSFLSLYKDDLNEIGVDADILSMELDEEKIILWNAQHPEHQYADLQTVIDSAVRYHVEMTKTIQNGRKDLQRFIQR